jgi:hypothetical protein
MINNSISGTSLAFVVLMFLSSFGACTKLTKCARCVKIADDVANNGNDLSNLSLEEMERYYHNKNLFFNLYKKYKEAKIGNGLKLLLPDIAKRLNDTRGYDNIFEIQDSAIHFIVQTKNQPKTEKGLFDDWLTFRKKISLTYTLLRIPVIIDSPDLLADKNGYLIKAYQYRLYNETVQGLVKLIETEDGFTFVEVETPAANENFYDISNMLLQAAILPESTIITEDSVKQTERRTN